MSAPAVLVMWASANLMTCDPGPVGWGRVKNLGGENVEEEALFPVYVCIHVCVWQSEK